MDRRLFMTGAAASAASSAWVGRPRPARADAWPSRPITLVVPYGAGGTSDAASRLYAEFMSDALKQQVVVENRPGAQGNIASDAVSRASPDGYTLMMGGNFLSQNPSTGPRPRRDPATALQPLSLLALSPALVMVHRRLGASGLPEVLRRAAEKPDAMTIGAGNIDAYVLLLLRRASAKLRLVNYRTSPQAITDLLGGSIDVAMSILTTALPLLEHPDLIPVAVSSEERSALLPNVPTYAECGIKDAEIVSWFGTFAPAGLPSEIAQRLSAESQRFLAAPRTAERFRLVGLDLPRADAGPFAPFVAADTARWRTLAGELGIKAD